MTHLFKRLLAAIIVGLTVGASVAAISVAASDTPPTRIDQADNPKLLSVGKSNVIYHFTQRQTAFELHVTIFTPGDLADVMKTRIQLRDGQVFSMVLNDDDLPENAIGDRVTFEREGETLLVSSVLAAPEVRFGSAFWPFS